MLLIGADPEVFVRKGETFISGHIFECGTKDRPLKTEHGSIQVDGLALEVNVTPADNPAAFVANVRNVFRDLISVVEKKDALCEIVAIPTAHFKQEFLDGLPEFVRQLGCNPDFNAYTGEANNPPDANRPFRTGAGHVHLGWTKGKALDDSEHFYTCCRLAKQLDFFLGIESLKWDTDSTRRQLYGAAGAFRPKSYGMEYRVLSNAWLGSEELITKVFNNTLKAWEKFQKNEILDNSYPTIAQTIINDNITNWDDQMPKLAEAIRGSV